MTGNEYQKLAMRTNDGKADDRLMDRHEMVDFYKDIRTGRAIEKYNFGGIINGCLGLSGEAGEFNDLIKKWIFHGHEMDEAHAKKELGDCMWYVAMICESFGWSLDEIMQLNIDKLAARYPRGFNTEQSTTHRKAGDL